jgi:hypothetical protein
MLLAVWSSPHGHSLLADFVADGVVIRPCTTGYLRYLCLELFRVSAIPLVRIVNDTDHDADENRAEFVVHEIKRLTLHPGLFPSELAQLRFQALIASDAELQFKAACSSLIIEAEISELEDLRRQLYSRPTYQPGMKGWENFLFNMAPGAPEDPSKRSTTAPGSSFQMVPVAGLRIAAEFEKEEREIVKYTEEADPSVGVKPAQTTLMIDFDKPTPWEERIPRRQLASHIERVVTRPSPFKNGRSIRDDVSERFNCELEDIGALLLSIEAGQQAPARLTTPSHFIAYSQRHWQQPTQYNELRFIAKE